MCDRTVYFQDGTRLYTTLSFISQGARSTLHVSSFLFDIPVFFQMVLIAVSSVVAVWQIFGQFRLKDMEASLKKLSFHYVLLLGLSSIWISEALLLSGTNAASKTSEHRKRSRLYLGGNGDRGTVEGSKFEGWYQRTIQSLSLSEPLVPIQLENSFSSNLGSLGSLNVAFSSKAWESKSLRYIRLISFVGEGYDVFNFMAVPRAGSAIPILGIDVVSLPRE